MRVAIFVAAMLVGGGARADILIGEYTHTWNGGYPKTSADHPPTHFGIYAAYEADPYTLDVRASIEIFPSDVGSTVVIDSSTPRFDEFAALYYLPIKTEAVITFGSNGLGRGTTALWDAMPTRLEADIVSFNLEWYDEHCFVNEGVEVCNFLRGRRWGEANVRLYGVYPNQVPEPSALASLMLAGLLILGHRHQTPYLRRK